jgi:protein-L-isoaspartate(D-aspartate) O-methyltransferase
LDNPSAQHSSSPRPSANGPGSDELQTQRVFFANLVASAAGAPKNERLISAFACTPREKYLGPGPWRIFAGGNLLETPSSDPAYLYQDVVVAIAPDRGINNGQPVLHALCLAALAVQPGVTIAHIGAGTGYYTAILAQLTGPHGRVDAYEIEADLAARATSNLSEFANVTVHHHNAAQAPLPSADVIYVNAGATSPLDLWLDALRPNGRLLFPLTPDHGPGGAPGHGAMLLVTRNTDSSETFAAHFVSPAMFIPCLGARDDATAAKLAESFKRGDARNVRSLRRNGRPDPSGWCAGDNWWLSTADTSQ